MEARSRALAALCVTEIVSWGVLYYAFPVLVTSISADTGWSVGAATGAFSVGALVSAGAGIAVGRLIDRRGPRLVMTTGSVVGVLAVLAIAAAPNLPLFYAAWALAGLGQSATLYPPAFAALTGWYGDQRVRALTTLTLVAGFASTVFAPLTAALVGPLGWRGTFGVLAVVLALVTVPLHALALTPRWRPAENVDRESADREHASEVLRSPRFVVVAAVMTLSAFALYGATINLVPLLEGRGLDLRLAALALGLTGAGQVLGRLTFVPLVRRSTPRTRLVAVLVLGAAGVIALALVPGPAPLLIALAVVAGAGRGLHTLLQASTVSDRWGTRAFGRINGVFSAPVTLAVALAPAGGVAVAAVLGGFPAAFLVLGLATLVAAGVGLVS
ncbi:MFS transporter [Actinomycetospora sp. NBRC 106375]|uniref:MFS transporter n=1 Tax=Actinomycetospora sp. NBRC 106375 TaxID=3032207 RepID=UPI0024A4AAC6|nr:MFS transporter [Actinomycetospora sp. NBRC 106375]GLZ48555.1 MFS transporter [Actinomycetospora sp. NBRC 106375]